MKTHRSRLLRLAAAGLALLTAACGDSLGPDPILPPERDLDAPLQTSELSYTMDVLDESLLSVTIPYTVQNRTSDRVYILNCNGATALHLERFEDGVWKTVWSPFIPLCLSPPIELVVGATLEREVFVSGGTAGCFCEPIFGDGEVEGIYRIVHDSFYHDYDEATPGFGQLIPESARVSNAFRLTR